MNRSLLAASLLSLGIAGCEPCAGTVACNGRPRLAVEGRLLDDETGAPVAGATVDFIRTGGVSLERDSVRAKTDAEGLYRVEVAASEAADVVGDLVVRLPEGGGYRVPSQTFQASTREGEAIVLSPWSTRPRLPDLAIAFLRGYPPENLAGATVEFRQTGGPALAGLTGGVYRTTTGSDGLFLLFGGQVQPLDGGEVVGDLTITRPPTPATVHAGVRIPVRHTFRPAAALRTFGVGPNLSYHIAVYDRGRYGVYVPGVRIEFHKTGGVPVDPADWTATTEAGGRIAFPVRALEHGVVTGDIRVIPPAPWKTYELTGLQFPTYDVDGAILYAGVGVGPGLPYYLMIRKNGIPQAGVAVEFRRVSGIAVNPSSFSATSNDSGMVHLTPTPASEGDVFADITVRPPSPHPTFVVRNLRLTAVDAERSRVLAGDWEITAPPTSTIRRP